MERAGRIERKGRWLPNGMLLASLGQVAQGHGGDRQHTLANEAANDAIVVTRSGLVECYALVSLRRLLSFWHVLGRGSRRSVGVGRSVGMAVAVVGVVMLAGMGSMLPMSRHVRGNTMRYGRMVMP